MDDYPRYRSHWIPRTRDGRIATVAFLLVFAVAMPPITHTVLDRIRPVILGLPFLYAVLLFVYCALIGVLLWALWRDV
jgi:hypothetical protein